MNLDSWQGFERFLSGNEKEEWLHMTSQETPDYLQEHMDAVQDANYQFDLQYMDSENLVESYREGEEL